MTEQDRWNLLLSLDEELLKGGVVISEWCASMIRESDTAFANGLFLASIITAMSAIETHLRAEDSKGRKRELAELIYRSGLESELINHLHTLRKYRNKWVHVDDPWDDEGVMQNAGGYSLELERMAILAANALRQTIYSNPLI